jgi:very-short-patch-repair endonuclease
LKRSKHFSLRVRQRCRELRREQTKAEAALWQALRNRKPGGLKFTRQHPLIFKFANGTRYFIADFYCHELKLVVELGGPIHDRQRERDKDRDEVIAAMGLRETRLAKKDVLEGLGDALERIKRI